MPNYYYYYYNIIIIIIIIIIVIIKIIGFNIILFLNDFIDLFK